MSSQDFDLLNMNIAPIDFDLEELMSIDSILPKSSHEIVNTNNQITENNTSAKIFPIFTPVKYSNKYFYNNSNHVATTKQESRKPIFATNNKISQTTTANQTVENIPVDKSEQITDSIHQNMVNKLQSVATLSNMSETQTDEIIETITSNDESEPVSNNDLADKKPQIIEPIVTLAKLADIDKTDNAVETINNDESEPVSNNDLADKKPQIIGPIVTLAKLADIDKTDNAVETISNDESEPVSNNDLTDKKPQIIEPIVTLAKLADIDKTDNAVETINNDESEPVSNNDLADKKPIEVVSITTSTDVVENAETSNKFLETFIANQPQNTDVKSDNATENLGKLDEVVATTPIKTDIIDKTTEPVAPKKVVRQQLNNAKTASHYQAEQPAKPNKILNAFFTGILFAVIGFLIDWGIHISRALATDVAGEINWLFFPFLAVIGAVCGFFFGAKALGVIFGTSTTVHLDDNPDDGFATGLFKAIGVGLSVAVVAWLVMLVLL